MLQSCFSVWTLERRAHAGRARPSRMKEPRAVRVTRSVRVASTICLSGVLHVHHASMSINISDVRFWLLASKMPSAHRIRRSATRAGGDVRAQARTFEGKERQTQT